MHCWKQGAGSCSVKLHIVGFLGNSFFDWAYRKVPVTTLRDKSALSPISKKQKFQKYQRFPTYTWCKEW